MSAPMPPCRCWVACTVALAALGGLPLGHPGGVGGVTAGVEAPGRVLPRDAHGLDVDGGVGRPQHGALERAERPAELLAARSGRRPSGAAPPRTRRPAARTARWSRPRAGRRAPRDPRRDRRGRRPAPTAHAGEMQMRVDLAVGGHGPLERHTPPPRGSTRADQHAARRRCAAGTTMRSARCAWGTASSVPSSTQPPSAPSAGRGPAGVDVGLADAAAQRGASASRRPTTTPGSQRARWASEPKRARGSAPSTRVDHSGTGATALPCASSNRHSSMRP